MTVHVLVICTHNSGRSVLAEAMLNHLAARLGKDVRAHSAGSSPSGRVNPLAIEALNYAGVDTRALRSKSWDEFSGEDAPPLSIVITVCDRAAAESCPVFFGGKVASSLPLHSPHPNPPPRGEGDGHPVKVHWGYPDPADMVGDDAARRSTFELTRQAIAYRMLQLLALPLEQMDRQSLQAALIDIGRS